MSYQSEPTVSILAEIPQSLHDSLMVYLQQHPDKDQDTAFCAALSLFLIQNSSADTLEASVAYRKAARVYLDALFKHGV